jgi:hypothetical protein
MALRLQIAGNIVRLATYHDNEFKEGVSLTIYDELARWEKYTFLSLMLLSLLALISPNQVCLRLQ